MKTACKLMGVAALIAVAIMLFGAGDAYAVHKQSATFLCAGCHSMHGTTAWDTTPHVSLLKEDIGVAFCMSCHNAEGTQDATAPSVADSSVTTAGRLSEPAAVGAGGYFYGYTLGATTYTNANSHDLSLAVDPTPPGNDGPSAIAGFYCATCHNHHGTSQAEGAETGGIDAFRNLNQIPDDNGSNIDVVGVETSYTVTTLTSGFATWCADCHDNFYDNASPYSYHPTDVGINAQLTSLLYEYGMDDNDTNTGQPIIKLEDPASDDARTSATATLRDGAANDDEVTCLTCHYSHGGPNDSNLRYAFGTSFSWTDPQTDTAANTAADPTGDEQGGCQICHNK